MPDYSDHATVLKLLSECQAAEKDMRDQCKAAHLFVTKADGQWEPEWWSKCDGKPRYTFDMTTPIIDQISGDIEQSDFDIKVSPAGGGADKDRAEMRDGLIRSIETISDAQSIYAHAGRNVATSGLDGWMVTTDYLDDNSFDTDIIIKPVHNFSDRVWFDLGSQRQDRSDSKYGFLLSAIATADYKDRWPIAACQSVSDGQDNSAYQDKADVVIIGHIYYRKETERELVKTSMGRVFERDEDFLKIEDELAAAGEVVEDTRVIKDHRFWVRKFSNNEWLGDEEETPFSQIPLVPAYGNFKVIENKPVYFGAVQKLMDPQRVLNYSLSREIEEGALAPRAKYWMTAKQVKGHEAKLASLNTNSDPVQQYNVDPEAPGVPQQNGGAQINPGLRVISDGMQDIMGRSAGIFAAGMGDNPNAQSGVAIDRLQDKSNNITTKYFKSLEIAVRQTGKLINDAIPTVYDTKRQVRIANKDGSIEIKEINQPIIDNETGDQIILNDLTVGKYDITCKAGPSYHSRQQETVEGIIKLAAIDPSIIQLGGDVLLNNISSPGVDEIAARRRRQLFEAGAIPEDQLTDEEKAEMQAKAQQPQQPDAGTLLAQAEMEKAKADQQKNMIDMQKAQAELSIKEQDLRLQASKVQLQAQEQELKFMEKMADANLKKDAQAFQQMKETFEMRQKALNDSTDRLNTEADTLKKLREAMAGPAIAGQQQIVQTAQR